MTVDLKTKSVRHGTVLPSPKHLVPVFVLFTTPHSISNNSTVIRRLFLLHLHHGQCIPATSGRFRYTILCLHTLPTRL